MIAYEIYVLLVMARYLLPPVIAAIIAGIVVGRNARSRILGAFLAGGTAVVSQWFLMLMALLKYGYLEVALFPLWNIFLAFLSIPVFVLAAVGAWITHRRPSKPPEPAGIT